MALRGECLKTQMRLPFGPLQALATWLVWLYLWLRRTIAGLRRRSSASRGGGAGSEHNRRGLENPQLVTFVEWIFMGVIVANRT